MRSGRCNPPGRQQRSSRPQHKDASFQVGCEEPRQGALPPHPTHLVPSRGLAPRAQQRSPGTPGAGNKLLSPEPCAPGHSRVLPLSIHRSLRLPPQCLVTAPPAQLHPQTCTQPRGRRCHLQPRALPCWGHCSRCVRLVSQPLHSSCLPSPVSQVPLPTGKPCHHQQEEPGGGSAVAPRAAPGRDTKVAGRDVGFLRGSAHPQQHLPPQRAAAVPQGPAGTEHTSSSVLLTLCTLGCAGLPVISLRRYPRASPPCHRCLEAAVRALGQPLQPASALAPASLPACPTPPVPKHGRVSGSPGGDPAAAPSRAVCQDMALLLPAPSPPA